MNQTDKPTGVPEDVNDKIEKMFPVVPMSDSTLWYVNKLRYAAIQGYSLALPELTAKEEEIKGKNNTIDILNKVINSQIEFTRELKEENAKLKEEVERGGWISVEDRLPEDKGLVSITVLTINKGGHIDCLHYWKGDWYKDHVLDTTNITHWQPLPPPPKSK